MALWRKDGFAEDLWTHVADGDSIPAAGAIIIDRKSTRLNSSHSS